MSLSDPRKLETHKKHTIEVVINRVKVQGRFKQRLAESFETALELSGGIVKVAHGSGNHGQSQEELISLPILPARPVVIRWLSWNRGYFPLTTQLALVRPVMALA